MYFNKCGAQIGDHAKFCPSCGAPTEAAGGQTQSQPAQQPQTQQSIKDNLKETLKGSKFVAAPSITFMGRQIPLKTALIILGVIVGIILILSLFS